MNNSRWTPATIPADAPSNPDGIDFVLTQNERSKVAIFKCALEDNRKKLNRADTAQSLADALVREGLA